MSPGAESSTLNTGTFPVFDAPRVEPSALPDERALAARVRATPLVRLSVLGPVGKPGFHYMPPDIPLGDAVMRAGGPGGSADLNKSVIRRNTEELYDSRNTRTAMNEGLTLDQLSLRDGDSIEIGEKSSGNWGKIASGIGVATSLILALSYVSRR